MPKTATLYTFTPHSCANPAKPHKFQNILQQSPFSDTSEGALALWIVSCDPADNFTYNYVFDDEDSQADIYESMKGLVDSSLDVCCLYSVSHRFTQQSVFHSQATYEGI